MEGACEKQGLEARGASARIVTGTGLKIKREEVKHCHKCPPHNERN